MAAKPLEYIFHIYRLKPINTHLTVNAMFNDNHFVIHVFYLRFGHSQVNTHLWRFEEDGTMSHYGHLPLRDAYFSPERVSREGGIEPLFRGAVRQSAQEVDLEVSSIMSIYNYSYLPLRAIIN